MSDEPRARQPDMAVGEPLDTHSVAELEERIGRLQTEIERTRAALEAKKASLARAASVFKL